MIVSRDDPAYPWHHRPADHDQAGLFIGGPKGEANPLAALQAYTHCPITAPTPENERKQRIAYRAREAETREPDDEADRPMIRVGRFVYPRKPANSGRKKKAAA